MLILNLVGVVLLIAGFAAAYRLARQRSGEPAADWFPDPATTQPRRRRWDARAWTAEVRPGEPPADRGRRFRGRFWGRWAWILLGTLLALVAGSIAYQATESVHVMAVTSFLGMTGVCWAFYRFVARQLALDDVIGIPELIAVAAAVGGCVILIAANVNQALLDAGGAQLATKTVGFVEEGTKLLVPLVFFALGRYRDPRAGVALGLAAGFGFAIVETTEYAYATASASGPDFCGGETPTPTTQSVIQAQIFRIFSVSPLHWLWTGIMVAVAWRLWHLYGREGTPAAVGVILLVMLAHSINDTSATLGCDEPEISFLAQLARWGIIIASYLVFRAAARKSTPPQLIGAVSRGWTPRHLKTDKPVKEHGQP